VVVDSLAAHLRDFPTERFIFTTEAGQPLRRTSFSAQVWRPAVQDAGLEMGAHFHDLRHYYASLLIRHGESIKVVQLRLGHASAAETLDTYSHLWPDSEDRTRDAVDSVLGASAESVRTAATVKCISAGQRWCDGRVGLYAGNYHAGVPDLRLCVRHAV